MTPSDAIEICKMSAACGILMLVVEAQYKLGQYESVFQGMLRDVTRRGSAYASFKIDDRPRGYSHAHWRKIRRQRVTTPVTIKLSRVSPWI